ncbi:hypothetical protein B9T26_08370 [Acinetobacter sp. ANC 4169]|nr:hypothetical protein B9T26_08370 [Acinetobacter sp. ANC 4169]
MQFSLTLDAIRVEMKNEQSFEIAKGLDFIELQSVRYRRLDALSLENMIEVIEEILEQFKLDHKIQRIAKTSDAYMQQISQLFFNGEAVIDRIKLEHAFNEFVEHIKYYVRQVDSEHFYVFVYFVFIREMMHHLNVVEISFKN